MTDTRPPWQRILTREAFCMAFAGRILAGDDLQFVIHDDGRLTGTAGSMPLNGRWYWQDGYFCRTARLGADDLGQDCELIEQSGDRMRYTRDRGRGAASVVSLA